MKFKRTPRLQILLDFRQLRHRPKASSHFRCRSRQVKQPVRVRLPFLSAIFEDLLRFVLAGRGELPSLVGVVALSTLGDSEFDCERVVRFILLLCANSPLTVFFSGSLISSANWAYQLLYRPRVSECTKSPG